MIEHLIAQICVCFPIIFSVYNP